MVLLFAIPVIALLEGRCAYEAARNASDAELQELDVLHERPISERAGVTRLLLGEGLQRLVDAGVTDAGVR